MPIPSAASRRLGAGLLVIAAAVTGCRHQPPPSGAQFEPDGRGVQVSALQPRCGCLTLRNASDGDILLRSALHERTLGETVLRQGGTLSVQFDWAGADVRDRYRLEGFDASGARLPLRGRIVIVDAGGANQPCGEAACEYGPLAMDAALRPR